MPTHHVPVLADAVVELLHPQPGDIILDGTLGGGGHAALLLERIQPQGQLYGFDQDPVAIAELQETVGKTYGPRQFITKLANFATIKQACHDWDITGRVTGILLDLGYSSDQLSRGRGFSFRAADEPLDLRMDPETATTAAELLTTGTTPMLIEWFRNYGELQQPQRLARVITERRLEHPIRTVGDLVTCVQQAYHTTSSDVLAKVWQACRIAVNDELAVLRTALTDGFSVLSPGGRLAVITFHSLEDRIVKQQFKDWSDDQCQCPPEFPVCICQRQPIGKLLTKKPITADSDELKANPRSRSAKLRAIKKL